MRKNATAQAMTTSNKSDASARTRRFSPPREEPADGVVSAAIAAARIRTTSTFIAAGWPATPMLDALRTVRANDG
jgi:hypothetical protein